MLYLTVGQARVFAAMCVTGLCCGAWYGIVRYAAKILRAGFMLNALLDLVSAAGAFAIAGAGLIAACYGEARLYALLGAILGFAVYRLSVGRLLSWAADRARSGVLLLGRALMQNGALRKIFR